MPAKVPVIRRRLLRVVSFRFCLGSHDCIQVNGNGDSKRFGSLYVVETSVSYVKYELEVLRRKHAFSNA